MKGGGGGGGRHPPMELFSSPGISFYIIQWRILGGLGRFFIRIVIKFAVLSINMVWWIISYFICLLF